MVEGSGDRACFVGVFRSLILSVDFMQRAAKAMAEKKTPGQEKTLMNRQENVTTYKQSQNQPSGLLCGIIYCALARRTVN